MKTLDMLMIAALICAVLVFVWIDPVDNTKPAQQPDNTAPCRIDPAHRDNLICGEYVYDVNGKLAK